MAEKLPSLAPKKMNWHIALIYFILWLMAFMDLCNGLISVFGVQFGPTADGGLGIALHVYPGYFQIYILDGVFMLAMCMYIVFVRFQLAGMKRRAPMLLTIMFVLNIVEALAFLGALYLTVPEQLAAYSANTGSSILAEYLGNAVLTAIVAALTHVYYLRRKEMFNK